MCLFSGKNRGEASTQSGGAIGKQPQFANSVSNTIIDSTGTLIMTNSAIMWRKLDHTSLEAKNDTTRRRGDMSNGLFQKTGRELVL